MAKYDFSGRRLEDFGGHFVCHVIGPLFEQEKNGGPKVDPKELDIVVKINDVEVDWQSFIDLIEQQMDRMVQDKAKEIVEEKFGDINGLLFDLQHEVKQLMIKRLPLVNWED